MLSSLFPVVIAATQIAGGQATDSVRSPYLRAWAATIVTGRPATSAFWQATATAGTPLVERIPGDERFVNVTFMVRGTSGTKSVAVVSLENHQLANDRYFALARLTRLGSTDIWYRTYRLRSDARFTYRLSVDDERLFAETTPSQWPARAGRLMRDSLNPNTVTTRDGAVSLVELPGAPAAHWTAPVAGATAGHLDTTTLGDARRGVQHALTIYTPPGYSSASIVDDFLIVLDGEDVPASVPVPTILDNLHAAHRIGATVAVLVANRPGKRITDLAYSDELLAFVRDDLIPWMRATYRVPRDPRRVVVAGRSASGNMAMYLAFELSSLIGNAISQSGGYALGPRRNDAPPAPKLGITEDDFPQNEWLTRRIATSPKRPVRAYVEVGTLEDVAWEFPFPQYATPTVLLANRHLRDVLDAKGYSFTYHEYNGPHDPLAWRGTLGDALAGLIGRAK